MMGQISVNHNGGLAWYFNQKMHAKPRADDRPPIQALTKAQYVHIYIVYIYMM